MKNTYYENHSILKWIQIIGGSKGGGQGGHGSPKGLTKMIKMAQFAAFYIIKKKNFPGGLPPDPPNSRIYSVSLALAATGPRQCERLEPSVDYVTSINELRYPLMKTHLIVLHFF